MNDVPFPEAFIRLAEALDPWLEQVVIVGGGRTISIDCTQTYSGWIIHH